MSKAENQVKNTQPPAKAEQPNADYENSPGKQLTKARVGLGLTQQQVADRLHLRLPSVQAVEEDALEKGVSVTFSKGYVRLYAKLVRLEAQPLLDAYDKINKLNKEPVKLQSFSRRVSREADDHKWNMVTIVVVLLVLGSVIGWWVQQSDSLTTSQSFVSETLDGLFSESDQASNDEKANTAYSNSADQYEFDSVEQTENENTLLQNTGPEIAEEDAGNFVDRMSSITDNSEDDELAQTESALVEEAFDDTLNAVSETLESTTDLAVTEATGLVEDNEDLDDTPLTSTQTSNGIAVNADGTVNMTFTFIEDTWVSVKDVNGEVIAVGLKTKGRVMKVSGLPPILVILGVPEQVEINFGGKDVDMSVYPTGRSANFSLSLESE